MNTLTDRSRQLLKKLREPLSFVGEMKGQYVCLESGWVRIESIIKGEIESSSDDQPILFSLKSRLKYIDARLSDGDLDESEEYELYLEGMGIKRALYILTKEDHESDRVSDVKRWLDYGKRIR